MRTQIRDGRVLCPNHGDADVEGCFGCAAFRRISRSGHAIECKPLSTSEQLRDALLYSYTAIIR